MKKEDAMKILDSLLWSGYFAPLMWPSEFLLENPTFFGGEYLPALKLAEGLPALCTPSCRCSALASLTLCDKHRSSAVAMLQPGRDKGDYSWLLDGGSLCKAELGFREAGLLFQ